ncbi:Piso0_002559 [Millerozyma farinosa CBS 7064]|uniref:Piso0_002559 protein n=1 Tax=Pichia sorbitophila (strain ATCC MYA-4447 / BCRC 22081 / CBS 7064 / NBRC 10061 / NRRL Y-12695) TaxID=559304 RepID=G8YFD1_PICSO|nr:Piso0_002559 [Millerozyma farinosa CBS 7064]
MQFQVGEFRRALFGTGTRQLDLLGVTVGGLRGIANKASWAHPAHCLRTEPLQRQIRAPGRTICRMTLFPQPSRFQARADQSRAESSHWFSDCKLRDCSSVVLALVASRLWRVEMWERPSAWRASSASGCSRAASAGRAALANEGRKSARQTLRLCSPVSAATMRCMAPVSTVRTPSSTSKTALKALSELCVPAVGQNCCPSGRI